jgi:hypothetical protein
MVSRQLTGYLKQLITIDHQCFFTQINLLNPKAWRFGIIAFIETNQHAFHSAQCFRIENVTIDNDRFLWRRSSGLSKHADQEIHHDFVIDKDGDCLIKTKKAPMNGTTNGHESDLFFRVFRVFSGLNPLSIGIIKLIP